MKEDILEAIRVQGIEIDVYGNADALYSAIDYNGSIHEIIDGEIDIYYSDLRQWAVGNWEYVEQANEEGLATEGKDYHKDIQAGQYIKLREDSDRVVEEIYNEFNEQ